MTKSRLEKVLEYMVNGESELATEMLHEHLIETARDIYADLAEEDEMFEAELELDDEDELDESLHDEDESGDFVDDLDTMENELEAESYFGEEEDEDAEAMDDLEGEMDIDAGDDMSDELGGEMGDDFGGEEGGNADLDSAMVNVEDAMEELRAAFADIMGDDMGDDEGGDEVSDEFDDMDLDDDGEEAEGEEEPVMDSRFGEGATLTKKPVTMKGDDDGKKSIGKQNLPGITKDGKAVKFAGADEKGGKAAAPKKMTVTGPQEQKGRMDKRVATPSNKSEKVKSNLGN